MQRLCIDKALKWIKARVCGRESGPLTSVGKLLWMCCRESWPQAGLFDRSKACTSQVYTVPIYRWISPAGSIPAKLSVSPAPCTNPACPSWGAFNHSSPQKPHGEIWPGVLCCRASNHRSLQHRTKNPAHGMGQSKAHPVQSVLMQGGPLMSSQRLLITCSPWIEVHCICTFQEILIERIRAGR